MLISCDVKGLEVVTAAYLSNDAVLRKEVLNRVDIHANNQADLKLPSRLIAKVFIFRMVYGGSAYGFVKDPDFAELKYSEKQWNKVIENFYEKYYGMKKWHTQLVRDILRDGIYTSPTGRQYNYNKLIKEYSEYYYLPKFKNYPVQGLGADIVMMARIILFRRLMRNQMKSKMVNTIHDSIIFDTPTEEKEDLLKLIDSVFVELPAALNKAFDINFDLPLGVEYKQYNGEPV